MQIRAFVKVADAGSVSKACQLLFRAQSVVTRAITSLEHRLEVPLFDRHADGMRLTDYGVTLLPRSRRVLAELESVAHLLSQCAEPLYLFQVRRLQLFVKLCETQHVQSVASLFGLTQPAVSAAVKVLEEGCGRSLFERTVRGLRPTRVGLEILFPIRRALNELRRLEVDLAAKNGCLQGVVHVGALPLGRTRILPEAIVRLSAKHPAVQVVTNESPFDLLVTELRAGDLDFIFGALRAAEYSNDLRTETLLTEEMVIVVGRGNPLLQRPITDTDLARAQWILPRAGSPARRQLDACFKQMGMLAPQAQVESGDMAVISGILLRSDMLAVVSARQLERDIQRRDLCILPWPLPDTGRDIGFTYMGKYMHAPAAQALMQEIKTVIAS